MKTSWLTESEIKRKWYIVDIQGKILGRVATVIAKLLTGKGKVDRVPNMDSGDYVVVINSAKIKLTGNKKADKKYYRHSGYPGGLVVETVERLLQKNPNKVITKAVKNMLPNNKHRDNRMSRLKVFPGAEHSHEAQKPEKVDLNSYI
ncbi:MAG: 50S ribosomal protein L13 [Patescibacteria group bacterium]|nr:50S ribosomal protein L13 [Patescibacteria group bacterium]